MIMDYEKAYKNALQAAKHALDCEKQGLVTTDRVLIERMFPELKESEDERIRKAILELVRQSSEILDEQNQNNMIVWLEKQGNPNKEYHRVPSTTLKRLYMNEAKYELLKSDIMEGIVGDFEKGTTHSYLTIKIPMLLCPSNCTKGDKVKLIIVREE